MLIPGHGDSPDAHNYTYNDRNISDNETYWYKIQEISIYGQSKFFGPITVQEQEIPSSFVLQQNRPNPFNPLTEIEYELPKEARTQLAIYDVLGKNIKNLVNESQPAGSYTVTWDGTDNSGNNVGSGIFLYKLVAGNQILINKMVNVE